MDVVFYGICRETNFLFDFFIGKSIRIASPIQEKNISDSKMVSVNPAEEESEWNQKKIFPTWGNSSRATPSFRYLMLFLKPNG